MTHVLLAAMAQQTMDLDDSRSTEAATPAVRGWRPRALQRHVAGARLDAPGGRVPATSGWAVRITDSEADAESSAEPGYDLTDFARRLAQALEGATALEVGPDVIPRPGLRTGDVVLVHDDAATGSERLVAVRDRGEDAVALHVRVAQAGPDAASPPQEIDHGSEPSHADERATVSGGAWRRSVLAIVRRIEA